MKVFGVDVRIYGWAAAIAAVAVYLSYAFDVQRKTDAERTLRETERAARPRPATIPGWEELEQCGSFGSFDGKKQLTFKRANVVELRESSVRTNGAWSYESGQDRYSISVGESNASYLLYADLDDGNGYCILVWGEYEVADLTKSWFAKITAEAEEAEKD